MRIQLLLSTEHVLYSDAIDNCDRGWIYDMPFVPRKDDQIEMTEMVGHTDIDHRLTELSWTVLKVVWNKDTKGYYADVYVEGN